MKNTKVTLVPLAEDDREQFILDNQWAFKHGALYEFGERDDHLDDNGEIISRKAKNDACTASVLFVFFKKRFHRQFQDAGDDIDLFVCGASHLPL